MSEKKLVDQFSDESLETASNVQMIKTRNDTEKAALQGETVGEPRRLVCNLVLISGMNAKPAELIILISTALQKRGTSPRAPGTTPYRLGETVITLDMIRRSCRAEKITVRQFSLGIKDVIINILLRFESNASERNIAKTMKVEILDVSKDEAIWASDFQPYNPRCSERVRN